MKALLLAALLPLAAEAQLTLYAVSGTAETAVTSTFQIGQVALNATTNVQFRVYNTGSAPVSVNVILGVAPNAGFTLSSPVLPYTIPANSTAAQSLNFTIGFTPASTASYSASLQINSLSVILLGSGISAPTLSAVSGCAGSSFNFGVVQLGASASCTFTLLNSNPQAVAVTNIGVNGLGFTGPIGVSTPFTLQPAQSATFSIQFTPPSATSFAGTLAVGSQSFSLSGIGALPPIPTPALQFDSAPFGSAQQRVLTMTIPGGSPTAFSGYVNLAFAPSTAVVSDDTEIVFLANGARAIPFTVAKNATQVLLNGQGSATFQTGTTEGAITFTVSTAAQFKGDPTTTFTIPGAKVMIESVTASKQRLGSLDITITGADNTYSTGPMSFSFLDTGGNAIGGAVTPNFSADFKKYYGTVKAGGSTFLALVSFPVIGSVAGIGGVIVTLTNAAGVATTASIPFH